MKQHHRTPRVANGRFLSFIDRPSSGQIISSGLPFSAIFLQLLAMRPVHKYNVSMGGDTPQVPVLSKLAMSDQRHDGITCWYTSQVEGSFYFDIQIFAC
jgi:hypothetical protein